MESIESEGKTVAEAVEKALEKLGLRRDQVEVQILQEASSGFIGLGAKPAKVRITEKLWGEPAATGAGKPQMPARKPILRDEPKAAHSEQVVRQPVRAAAPKKEAEKPKERHKEPAAPAAASAVDAKAACASAEQTLKELAGLMGLAELKLETSFDAQQERVKVIADGADAERLIGPEGRTLEALQFLSTLIVGRKVGAPVAVLVDAHGYWDKKEQEILAQARRAASEVKSTRKPVRLQPMEAPMRRLVHRDLAENPDVETSSEGEGSWRKIVIRPRKG
jgi:spoIIIJ-associated protein